MGDNCLRLVPRHLQLLPPPTPSQPHANPTPPSGLAWTSLFAVVAPVALCAPQVGLEVQDEVTAIAPRGVQGMDGAGLLRVYLRSERAIFELDPASDEWQATQDLEENLFVSRVTLQPTGQEEEFDVTPDSFMEEAGEAQDTSDRVVLDADFVVQEPEDKHTPKKGKGGKGGRDGDSGRTRRSNRF